MVTASAIHAGGWRLITGGVETFGSVSVNHTKALANLGGGMPGTRHPLWDPILSFLHTFSPKSTCVGGPCPLLTGARLPLREILDPPLQGVVMVPVNMGMTALCAMHGIVEGDTVTITSR